MGMSLIFDTIRSAIQTSPKTRYRLWKETGVDQAQLSRLVAGQKCVSLDNLERLAEALGLEIVIRPRQKAAAKSKKRR